MGYNYKKGKERIESILKNNLECVDSPQLPENPDFTFDNGYCSWISSIFITIQNYDSLIQDCEDIKISKILRSFTSEVIEILRSDDNCREIGIRGNEIYATYTTPNNIDEYNMANITFYINTFIKMLNKLLVNNNYPTIEVGIGLATSKELVVKAGRKGVNIYDNLWIGGATAKSSNLSKKVNSESSNTLIFSKLSYDCFIEELVKNDGEKSRSWFHKNGEGEDIYYEANIFKTNFKNWIYDGMLK